METKIAAAFVAALSEMKTVTKDSKNPFLKNEYASLDAIIEAAKPVLSKHDLAFFQNLTTEGVETVIIHNSGEIIRSGFCKIETETAKGLSLAQSFGVAVTYTKRYQLGAMLGISTDKDVDAQYNDNSHMNNLAPAQMKTDDRPWITEAQFKKVLERINSGDTDAFTNADKAFRMKTAYKNTLEQANLEI